MKHVEYIVASYMGDRIDKLPEYQNDRTFFLRKHLASLGELKHSLDGITVVHNGWDLDPSWIPSEIAGVRVRVMLRDNVGMSYGAYDDAIMVTPEATHFVLVEDDYVFTFDDFDAWMLERLPSGMLTGAVWDWAWEGSAPLPTATMFLGMVNADAIRNAIAKGWNGVPVVAKIEGYRAGYFSQIAMSQAIVQAGYEIRDWLDEKPSAFWNSSWGCVDWFAGSDDVAIRRSPVVPLQARDRDVLVRPFGRDWMPPGLPITQRVAADGSRG